MLDSKRYKTFIQDRDKALEKIHVHTQIDLSRILDSTLENLSGIVARLAISDNLDVYSMGAISQALEEYIRHSFSHLHSRLVERIFRMRVSVLGLTYTSELEAIGRATKRKPNLNRSHFEKHKRDAINRLDYDDRQLDKRVWAILMSLRARIMKAFNLSIISNKKMSEILDDVEKAYPKIISYKRPPRHLKAIREADKKPKTREWFDFGFITDEEWEQVVEDYKTTYLPPSRFDDKIPIEETGQYNWELEQEVTQDFVEQVRSSKIDAANDMGIKDFVWIAVIDSSTDECCLQRMGKTTTEIEQGLQSGEIDAELCDAIVPAAHFKCRCDIDPVGDVEPIDTEKKAEEWNSFNDWINS
jgi:hypothetical protein